MGVLLLLCREGMLLYVTVALFNLLRCTVLSSVFPLVSTLVLLFSEHRYVRT
jgi:hypothetical protein